MMTRSRIFTFFMVALLGGFVLSTSFDAWAAKENKDVDRNVINWAKQYGIAKGSGKSVTEAQKDFEQQLEKVQSQYNKAMLAVMSKCAEAGVKNVADRTEGCASHAGKSWDSFWKGDWENAKKELKASFDNCKSGYGSYLGFLEAPLKAGWSLAQKLLVPRCSYDYTYEISKVKELCENLNVLEHPDIKQAIAKVENGIAQQTQQAVDKLCRIEGKSGEIFQHCVEDSRKKQVCMDFRIDFAGNTIESLSGVTIGCEPLPFKVWQARSCVFCPLFEIIFNTIQSASTSAYVNLGKSLSTIVAIGLALWIALMVLQNVSAMTKQDALEFLTNLFKNSFKVVIAFFMLRNSGIVYNWIIGPFLEAGFEFGASFLNSTPDVIKNCTLKGAGASGVLPDYIYNYLLCFIQAVQNELGISAAIGDSMMCISRNAAGTDVTAASIKLFKMPDFSMMLQGALVWAISFILSISFAFYLIDATVQLGIFGVLLPFLILCWPFKITNEYFKKGVGIFMNSWFVFVFMGIVVNIVLQLIGQSLTGGKADLTTIEAAINGNNVQKLKDILSIGFSGFLVLIACCVFSIKLMMKVEELAGKFSGGGGLGLGIGAKIGGLAAQGATAGAKYAMGAAKGVASGVANAKVWETTDAKGNTVYRSLSDGASAVKNKIGNAIGRGFTKGTKATGRAIAKPFTAIANAIRNRDNADGPRNNPSE